VPKKTDPTQSSITIVSGLPRSGTTMMMRMLEAGGMDPFVDHIRKPDADNPKGYYEYEKVKQLKEDSSWMINACGKAIKIISILLTHIPSTLRYKIIFMRRDMQEILASQKKMLERAGQSSGKTSDAVMAAKFNLHLNKTINWLEQQDNIDIVHINYKGVIEDAHEQAALVDNFLANTLDVDEMVQVVDNRLYRQRRNRR